MKSVLTFSTCGHIKSKLSLILHGSKYLTALLGSGAAFVLKF